MRMDYKLLWYNLNTHNDNARIYENSMECKMKQLHK